MADKPTDLEELHSDAKSKFDDDMCAVQDFRDQSLEDRRFYSIVGAQYDGDLGKYYENRPKTEYNLIHQSIIRIFNEYRNNRITVDFTPKNEASDSLSETCDGLYRADEMDSNGQEAYDNAFEEMVGGGFGAWRITPKYDDYNIDDDEQRICIDPIHEADSCVIFDSNAMLQDKSDASHCFVLVPMSEDAFKEEYPDEDLNQWPRDINSAGFRWYDESAKKVYLAEYYVKKEEDVKYHYFKNPIDDEYEKYTDDELENDADVIEKIDALKLEEERTRKIKKKSVYKYLLGGAKVLEDLGKIPGECIPIVPAYGKRWIVDGKEQCMGHVRLAKDLQRLLNMGLSDIAEQAALTSWERPIVSPKQMKGLESYWNRDHIDRNAFLPLNPPIGPDGKELPIPPLNYTKAPSIPPATGQMLQFCNDGLFQVLGKQEAGEELKSNVSGKAVQLVQNRLDMQTFIYMDNFAKAMRRSGQIWMSMAKELYVKEGRRMRTIDRDKKQSMITLQESFEKDGTYLNKHDLRDASIDVYAEVGPSSSSKRDATVKALSGLLSITKSERNQEAISALILMNMEGEGLSDIRPYFRKQLVAMGMAEPNEEEREQMEAAGNQPNPEEKFMQAAANEANAKADKANADAIKVIKEAELKDAQAQKTRVETAEMMQEMSAQMKEMKQFMQSMQAAFPPVIQEDEVFSQ